MKATVRRRPEAVEMDHWLRAAVYRTDVFVVRIFKLGEISARHSGPA